MVLNEFPYNGIYRNPTRAEVAAEEKQQRRIRYHHLLFIQFCMPLTPEELAELAAVSVEFEGEPIEGALTDSEYEFMRAAKQKAVA